MPAWTLPNINLVDDLDIFILSTRTLLTKNNNNNKNVKLLYYDSSYKYGIISIQSAYVSIDCEEIT